MAAPSTERILLPLLELEAFLEQAGMGSGAAMESLAEAWRGARRSMRRLAESEPWQANSAAILPLPATMQERVDAVTGCPRVAAAFRDVPVAFGLVDVDALMASRATLREDSLQHWVSRAKGSSADDPVLVNVCLPTDWEPRRYEHSLSGTTLRLLSDDPTLSVRVAPASPPDGDACGFEVVAAAPPPLLHAARLDGRLVLLDGHHRARALGMQGVRYVPCMISACEDIDDVCRLAPWLARDAVAEWFGSARPPMLRDFARRSLVHVQPVRPRRELIEVKFVVSRHRLP